MQVGIISCELAIPGIQAKKHSRDNKSHIEQIGDYELQFGRSTGDVR